VDLRCVNFHPGPALALAMQCHCMLLLARIIVILIHAPPAHLLSFFLGLRGGVTGRPIFMPPYGYFAFFSAGFSIYGKNCKSLLNVNRKYNNIPGRNTVTSRLHSSSHPHCQTLHSNLAQKIMSPSVFSRRTRTRPRRPGKEKEMSAQPP